MTVWPRVLFVVIAIGVTVLSLLPAETTPPTFGVSDKLLHVTTYFALALVAAHAFAGSGGWWRLALPIIALGALLEGAQALVPGRYPEVADIVANALGVVFAMAAYHLIGRWLRDRRAE